MVKTSTRRTTEGKTEVETEVDLKVDAVETSGVSEYVGPWFPVTCECGAQVISDNEANRARTISHVEHLGWLGQALPPEAQVWTSPAADDGAVTPTTVTPKDGKVTLTLEQFEQLAAGAGLTKVDPVA